MVPKSFAGEAGRGKFEPCVRGHGPLRTAMPNLPPKQADCLAVNQCSPISALFSHLRTTLNRVYAEMQGKYAGIKSQLY